MDETEQASYYSTFLLENMCDFVTNCVVEVVTPTCKTRAMVKSGKVTNYKVEQPDANGHTMRLHFPSGANINPTAWNERFEMCCNNAIEALHTIIKPNPWRLPKYTLQILV